MTTHVTQHDAERIAAETAKRTVTEFMLALGVNASSPSEILELQKDFAHVRESRIAMLAIKSKAAMTILSLAVTGAVTALWFSLFKH